MYTIEKRVVGSYQAVCYAITNEAGTLVIDPGAQPQILLPWLADKNVVGIVVTHCHSDHIGAVNELVEATGAWVACGVDDIAGMNDTHRSGFDEEGIDYVVDHCEVPLQDGDMVTLGEDSWEVLHTPGHTPGSICLWDRKNNVMFSGDMLFFRGIGSVAFVLGNAQQMRESCARLSVLPAGIKVFPGHGPTTTLDAERAMLQAYSRMHSAWYEG